MRVGVVTIAPSPHLAGSLAALARVEGVSLEVRCLQRSLTERLWDAAAQGVDWQQLDERAGGGIRGLVERADAVVVASSYFRAASWHAVARAAAGLKSVAVWWEPPSTVSPLAARLVRPILVRRFLRRVDGLIGITEATADLYRTRYGFRGLRTWCPYHRDLTALRSVEGVPPGPGELRLLALGALVRRKGLDLAIRALGEAPGAVTLDVVGDGPELGRLARLAAHVAPGRVRFRPGVPYLETAPVLGRAHGLVIPSHHDGFGMAVVEALAAGVPVIASTGVASAVQYVTEGGGGWIVPRGSVGELAMRFKELADRWREWPELSCAARACLSAYDADADAARLAGFLQQLIARRGAPGAAA